MSQVLDQLNSVLTNVSNNRAQAATQLAALQKQLIDAPKQIQQGIDNLTKTILEMDTAIAAIQVVVTDEQMLTQTAAQIEVNSGPLTPAASGGSAAGQQSATGAASAGEAGVHGVSDQSAAPAGNAPAAANGAKAAA